MANKKITELPFINTITGSSVWDNPSYNTVVPVVLYGTTNQITVENFAKYINLYNAHTGSAGNTFSGPQTINNNVTINGRLTVNEVVTQYETASVLFSTGSTKLGDQLTDKHEFTGSTNITGSLIYNNVLVANVDINTISRLQQATQSLQVATASIQQATQSLQSYTASADSRFLLLQQTTQSLQVATASLQAHSASVDAQLLRLQQTTQSLQVATASLQEYTASADSRFLLLQQTTQSLQVATASLNNFTASQDSRNFVISQYTSSTDAHIVGISAFTSSQLAVNLGNAIYTASVDSHIVGISTYTSSVRDTLARVHQATASIQATTASINSFTSSTNAHIVGISTYTSSNESWKDGVRGEVSRIEAWTASLDSTYATDAQLYQLYQSTRSLELHSGSMIGVTNGLMAYTASNSTLNTGLRGEVDGIEAYTASLKGQAIVSSSTQVQNYDVFALNSNLYRATGSLIGITNGLMAFTAALDTTYATDTQLYQLYQATRSIELHSGSMVGITNGLMAYTSSNETWKTGVRGEISAIEAWTASLDSTYATDAQLYQLYAETASMKSEIAGIESYTASLKGAAIVSSSQQIKNYYTFAQTASANIFYGKQSITGSFEVGVGTSDNTAGDLFVDTANKTVYVGRQSSTSGDNTIFAVRNRLNTLNALYVDAGGNGSVNITGSFEVSRGVKLGTATGNVEVVGNLVMTTAGNGIDFSATSNSSGTTTSEVFDDYEYGTWTPVLRDDPSAGNTATIGNLNASYTKVGRLVTLQVSLGSITTTGMTAGNTVYITGLPFGIASDSQISAGACNFYNVAFGETAVAWINAAASTTYIRIIKQQTGTTNATLIVSDITNNTGEVSFTITYHT